MAEFWVPALHFFVPSGAVNKKLSRLVFLPTGFLFFWTRVFMLHEAPIYEGLTSTHNPGWCLSRMSMGTSGKLSGTLNCCRSKKIPWIMLPRDRD
jgi:hypothetical protein